MAKDGEPIGMLVTRRGQIVDVYQLGFGGRLYVPVGGIWGDRPWEPPREEAQDPDQEAGG